MACVGGGSVVGVDGSGAGRWRLGWRVTAAGQRWVRLRWPRLGGRVGRQRLGRPSLRRSGERRLASGAAGERRLGLRRHGRRRRGGGRPRPLGRGRLRFGSVVVVVLRGERSIVVLGAGGSVVVVGVVVVVVVGSSGSVDGACRSRGGAVVVVAFSASGWVVGVGWSFSSWARSPASQVSMQRSASRARRRKRDCCWSRSIATTSPLLVSQSIPPSAWIVARLRMARMRSALSPSHPLRALRRGGDDVAVPDRQVGHVGGGADRALVARRRTR